MEKNVSKEERIRLEKKEKRKRIWLLTGLSVVGIVILAVLLWRLSGAEKEPSETVVFKVGEEAVYLDEVNLCILQNMTNLGITSDVLDKTAEDGSNADDYYKNQILQVIWDYKVEAQVAKQHGITLSEEEEQAVRTDAMEYMGKIDGHTLRQLGITQERIIEIYTQRYLAHALEQSVVEDITVEDQNYSTIFLLLFPKIEMDASGDYVTQKDGETPVMLSDEEIAQRKQDAEAAYQDLLDGADIEEVADKYGVKQVSGEESNLVDSFGEPFSDAAKNLKDGEYSQILETESCYAILKMLQSNNEEMASQILEYYKTDLEQDTINENKSKWYQEAGVEEEEEVTDNVWKSLSLYDFVQYVEE